MNLDIIHAIEKMGNVKIQIKGENLHVDYLDLDGCTGLEVNSNHLSRSNGKFKINNSKIKG